MGADIIVGQRWWPRVSGSAVAAENMFTGIAKQCNAGRGKAGQGRQGNAGQWQGRTGHRGRVVGGQASWCYERHPLATCTLQPQNKMPAACAGYFLYGFDLENARRRRRNCFYTILILKNTNRKRRTFFLIFFNSKTKCPPQAPEIFYIGFI